MQKELNFKERAMEFIDYLIIMEKLPLQGEKTFSDGYDMYGWYKMYIIDNEIKEEDLKLKEKIINLVKQLNKTEKKVGAPSERYHYSTKRKIEILSNEQKLTEILMTIREIKRFPKPFEFSFRDGFEMNGWWHKYNNKNNNKTSKEELLILAIYCELQELHEEISERNNYKIAKEYL